MNSILKPILITLLLLVPFEVFSQSELDSTYTPFRKGMWISGLSGTMTSNTFIEKNSNLNANANTFDLKSNSAIFIKERWALGWNIIISGSGNSANGGLGSSEISIGPYSRYYFSKTLPGALYVELTALYTNLTDRDDAFNSGQVALGQEITLDGGGFRAGLGYTHILRRGIAFDFGMEFNALWAGGDVTDLNTDTTTPVNVYIGGIEFDFGFIIFINEFFY
ncbi:hypothetical protein [Sediminitomix flava]|uniref:Outer membrane protein with beta-barrel domain n=1 Tax=Sediminitomix flava TaxID=379075 RepID=A0A315Z6W0_SEDFL|nr:hypothetical protein [Sediminitomix flava]PWJ40137.1 hypothetical protein BC781_105205 [Sediminitomix flava]